MLSEAFFFVLASNLEHFDGSQALATRGLNPNYTGKGLWGFVPIQNQEHWFDIYSMLIDAVETEGNTTIDQLLVLIEHPPVALE